MHQGICRKFLDIFEVDHCKASIFHQGNNGYPMTELFESRDEDSNHPLCLNMLSLASQVWFRFSKAARDGGSQRRSACADKKQDREGGKDADNLFSLQHFYH